MEEPLKEKIDYEYETFISNLKLCSKDNIIARSDEIILKQRIVRELYSLSIPKQAAWYLLAEDNVLEMLYRQIKEQKYSNLEEYLNKVPVYTGRIGGAKMSAKMVIVKEKYEEYRKDTSKKRYEEIIEAVDKKTGEVSLVTEYNKQKEHSHGVW